MVTSALWVLLVVADLPAPRLGACEGDDDCVITTQSQCCDCCPGVPRSVARSDLGQLDCSSRNCGVVGCNRTLCKPAQDPSTLQAVCRAGTCRAEPVRVKKNASFCANDSDCLVSSFSCCESCCPAAPRATTAAELEALRGQCVTTMCPMVRCAREQCKPMLPPGQATCRNNRCELTHQAPAQCRSDDDCRVSYPGPAAADACHRSPCGCCPGLTPVAEPNPMSVASTVVTKRPDRRRGKVTPLSKNPPFGLSQPQANPPPQCAPCESPTPAIAECRAGRCTLRD